MTTTPEQAGERTKMTFMTTLNAIREHNICKDRWERLLKHLGKTKADDEPLSLLTILDSNGLDDALWCCRAVSGHERDFRLFAVWCIRRVQHLMTDARSIAALDVAELYADGKATDEELDAARDAAWAAVWDAAWATRAAAIDAAWATRAVAWAAVLVARDTRTAQETRFRQMLEDGAFIGSTQDEKKNCF